MCWCAVAYAVTLSVVAFCCCLVACCCHVLLHVVLLQVGQPLHAVSANTSQV